MYYKSNQAENFAIPGGTAGRIYPSSTDGALTVAHVSMDGVYPEKGYSINSKCTETMFMISGRFVAEVDGKEYILEPGDVLAILPGQKYKTTGKGELLDVITPAWEKSQNQIIES